MLQVLLWSPIGHDVENYHKLTKVNVSILKIRLLVINCLMTLFSYHLIEPHNRILKQSLIYFVIARYKERNMRILLWSLIKFLLHQHCLKFLTFIFVTTNQHQPCLSLPCLSRTFGRCVSQVFQCQLQGNIPSSSCEKIFSKFGRQDAF